MKSLNFTIVFLLLLLLLCACDEEKGGESLNGFSVSVNNDFWKGTTEIQTDESSDSVTIFGIMDQPEGYFWMRIKFEGAKVYTLTRNQVEYTSLIGGDVATSKYVIDPNKSGSLTISAFDPENGLVDGSFQFELKKQMANPDSQFPAVLNFTAGNLKGTIPNP